MQDCKQLKMLGLGLIEGGLQTLIRRFDRLREHLRTRRMRWGSRIRPSPPNSSGTLTYVIEGSAKR